MSYQLDPKQILGRLKGRHIMLAIHSLEGGGSERQMTCLANHLARDSSISKVSLITLASRALDMYRLAPNIQRFELHPNGPVPETKGIFSKLYQNFSRVRKLQRLSFQLRPDVIVSFCDMNNALVLLALGKQFPCLISERSDPRFQTMPAAWERIRRKVYRRAQVCVAQTDAISDYLRNAYFPRHTKTRFLTLPSAIEPPEIDWNEISQSRAKNLNRLLFVGRLSPEKQVDQILRAWQETHAHLPNWKLRVVGKGPLESELKRLAKELMVDDSVEWAGWSSDIWGEYRTARAFIMASRYEGFPQSLIEAMTMGLPCCVTNFSPAIGECIEHQESGFVMQKVSDLPIYLRQINDDPLLEQRISIRARMISRRYHWLTLAPGWESAIAAALPPSVS